MNASVGTVQCEYIRVSHKNKKKKPLKFPIQTLGIFCFTQTKYRVKVRKKKTLSACAIMPRDIRCTLEEKRQCYVELLRYHRRGARHISPPYNLNPVLQPIRYLQKKQIYKYCRYLSNNYRILSYH